MSPAVLPALAALAVLAAPPRPAFRPDLRPEPPIRRLMLRAATETANGVVLVDDRGTFERTDWSDPNAANDELGNVLQAYFDAGGPDAEQLVVHASFPLRNVAAFYAPIANDVHGLGYVHTLGEETFDFLPGYELEGLLLQNDVHSYDPGTPEGDAFTRLVFGQELGHRWGAFVHADGLGGALLGRDAAHWSYFLDTGGSPLEGNAWRDEGNGVFRTANDVGSVAFSDLDLYLMGLLPPDQVAPFFLVESPDTRGQRDDFGRPLEASSPPSLAQDVRITGVRTDLGVEDVIAVEGPRSPGASAPAEVRIAFVLVVRPGQEDDAALLGLHERVVRRHAELWSDMTRGLSRLTILSGAAAACEGVTCADGERCEGGACVDACLGVTCPGDLVCAGGRCVDPCEGVLCPDGMACEAGACVPAEPPGCVDDLGCAAGERCVDEACVPRAEGPCAAVICAEGHACVDGRCVAPCEGSSCEPDPCARCALDEVCQAGACVPFDRAALCADVTCPEGERCLDGVCVPRDASGGVQETTVDERPAASCAGCGAAPGGSLLGLLVLATAAARRRSPRAPRRPS